MNVEETGTFEMVTPSWIEDDRTIPKISDLDTVTRLQEALKIANRALSDIRARHAYQCYLRQVDPRRSVTLGIIEHALAAQKPILAPLKK